MMRAIFLILMLSFPFVVQAAKGGKSARASGLDEPPRIMAALQQAGAAERGTGIKRNNSLAIALYCDAGSMGSPEGFFRVGRILARSHGNQRRANAYFALAARLGHREAAKHHNPRIENADISGGCGSFYAWMDMHAFDIDSYVASLANQKRKVAALIRSMAPQYGIDTSFAMSIALAESNLEPRAVSPKNAQGVMQLIPATQERFGIKNAFDPKQNIRGGLTYLRWLHKRYAGNRMMMAAAYNAGEGAVDKYGGVPPYAETQQYVRRVLYFSGSGTKKNAVKKETEKQAPKPDSLKKKESEKPALDRQS